MKRVIWTASAAADRRRALEFIAADNPIAARRLALSLDQATERLMAFPQQGRPGLRAGTRELVTVPPYIIVYRQDPAASAVVILRVWHAAQDR